jgi:hypothetical protein
MRQQKDMLCNLEREGTKNKTINIARVDADYHLILTIIQT